MQDETGQPLLHHTIEHTDEHLMGRIQYGDRAAFDALYARWKDPLIRYLIRRTGSRARAEDALQETWIRVYRYRHRYQPGRPVRPWLYRIATNAGNDAWRPSPTDFAVPVEGFAQPGADPIQLRDTLVSALHGLAPKDRRLLLLTIEGFTAAEVGEIMGLSVSAVRMRLSRARKKIRAAMEA